MSKQKMLAARELIKEKRYAEARALLKTENDPKAKEWLRKLDQIAPESRARKSLDYVIGGIIGVVVVSIGVFWLAHNNPVVGKAFGVIQSLLTQTYNQSGVVVRYPEGWVAEAHDIGLITLYSSPSLLDQLETTNSSREAVYRSAIESGVEIIVIYVERDLRDDESVSTLTQRWHSQLSEFGFFGTPNIVTEISEIESQSRVGHAFGFRLLGDTSTVVTIDVGSNNATTFVGITGNSSEFAPLLMEIVNSFTFDEALAGNFACPIARWSEGGAGESLSSFADYASSAVDNLEGRYLRTDLDHLETQISLMRFAREDFSSSAYPSCGQDIHNSILAGIDYVLQAFEHMRENNLVFSQYRFAE